MKKNATDDGQHTRLPNKRSLKEWRSFVLWLRSKSMQNVYDFENDCKLQWKLSTGNEWLVMKTENDVKNYKLVQENGRQLIYEQENEEEPPNSICKGVLATFCVNRLHVIDEFSEVGNQEHMQLENHVMFNEHTLEAIETKDGAAASDASVRGKHMGGTWIIGGENECETQEDSVWSDQWMQTTRMTGESATTLELINAIVENAMHLTEGKVKTHIDCQKMHDQLTSRKVKASTFAGDGGSMISKIRTLRDKTRASFEFVHVNTRSEEISGRMSIGRRMLKQCDQKSKDARRACEKDGKGERFTVNGCVTIHKGDKSMKKPLRRLSNLMIAEIKALNT